MKPKHRKAAHEAGVSFIIGIALLLLLLPPLLRGCAHVLNAIGGN